MPPTEAKTGCALRGAPPGESEGGHRPTKGKKMQHNTTKRSLNPEGKRGDGNVGNRL